MRVMVTTLDVSQLLISTLNVWHAAAANRSVMSVTALMSHVPMAVSDECVPDVQYSVTADTTFASVGAKMATQLAGLETEVVNLQQRLWW